MLDGDSGIVGSVALRRLSVADPRSPVVLLHSLAGRKVIVGRRRIEVVAVRDLHTWMVVREVLVRKVAIVPVDRDIHVQKQVGGQKVAVRQKPVVVRLAKVPPRNVGGLKADDWKVTVQNAEPPNAAVLAGNRRVAMPTWKP